jgi:thiamine transporter ThiT
MKNKVIITKRIKKGFLGIGISMLVMLIIHYFLISKININSTVQVFIDFIIFWFVFGIAIRILKLTKKRKNKSTKRKKGKWSYLFYSIIIPVLIIHHFLISKININSTMQIFIDFIISFIILMIFVQIEELIEKKQKNKK